MNVLAIKKILSAFDEKELKALQNYLAAFNGTFGENHQTKLSLLLKTLTTSDSNDKDIQHSLNVSGDSFRKLLDRLRDKAFDSLLLDININRKGVLTNDFKAFVDAKNDYTKARLCIKKGLDKEAYRFINKGILKAKKFEIYTDLLELLYLKQRFVNLRQGKAAFEKVEKEIEHYEVCRAAYNRAARFNELLHQRVGFNNSKQENQAFLSKCISTMKKDFSKTKSPFIKQKILTFQMQYFEENNDFKNCLKTALTTIDFLTKNKILSSNNQIGAAYLNASRYHIILNEYAKAKKCTDNCINYFNEKSYAYAYTKELNFYIAFYQSDYNAAYKEVKSLLKDYKDWDYQKEKWNYLLSASYFKLNDYKNTNKILNKEYPNLDKDKEGWGVYLIILKIMTEIELQQFDLADTSIDHLQYYLKSKQPKARIKAIKNYLIALRKEGYEFKKLSTDKNLEKLSSNTSWYTKQNMEAELVWFDDWVREK